MYLPVTAALVVAFGTSLCLTPIVRYLSCRTRRFGPSTPGEAFPVPPTGGIAIFLSSSTFALFAMSPIPVALACGASAMALAGLLDDVRPLRPAQKLALQAAAAGLAVGLGLRANLTGIAGVDGLVTGLWLIWMANAFNVLDMMDGLAAGVGVVAGTAMVLLATGSGSGSVPAAAVAGALAGFLIYNRHPARIYMGDTGSMFAGFSLAGVGVLVSTELSAPQSVLCPFLVLGVPTFEAAFLTVVRHNKGIPVTRASRDHVAQRLVQLGASLKGAVGRIHLASILLAGVALLGALAPGWLCWTYLASCVAIALALGIRLGRVTMDPS